MQKTEEKCVNTAESLTEEGSGGCSNKFIGPRKPILSMVYKVH